MATEVEDKSSAVTAGHSHDRPLHIKAHGCIFVVWVAVVIYKHAAAWWPETVGMFYPDGLCSAAQLAVGRTLALLPFSVSEVAATLIFVALAGRGLVELRKVIRRTRRFRNAAAGAALVVVSLACLIDMWGGIMTPPAFDELARYWDWRAAAKEPPTQEDMVLVVKDLVVAINAAYARAGVNNQVASDSELKEVHAAIDEGFKRLRPSLNLPDPFGLPRGNAKPSLYSWPNKYLNELGYLSLYTQEAMYNRFAPKVELPYIIAHEQAHLRDFINEDEATALGALACINSDNAAAQISGYWPVFMLLLYRLQTQADVDGIIQSLCDEARSHGREMQAFADKYNTIAARVTDACQDVSLRVGGEKRGMQAYSDVGVIWAVIREKRDLLFP